MGVQRVGEHPTPQGTCNRKAEQVQDRGCEVEDRCGLDAGLLTEGAAARDEHPVQDVRGLVSSCKVPLPTGLEAMIRDQDEHVIWRSRATSVAIVVQTAGDHRGSWERSGARTPWSIRRAMLGTAPRASGGSRARQVAPSIPMMVTRRDVPGSAWAVSVVGCSAAVMRARRRAGAAIRWARGLRGTGSTVRPSLGGAARR